MQFADKTLDLNTPKIMGVLNVTPDSFSDGGRFKALDQALRHAEQMLADGADIIDIGGESTRPGAAEVSLDEELARTIPIIETLKSRFDPLISIDTSKPAVMRAAAQAGAGLINDVRALQQDDALSVAAKLVAEYQCAICLMHMQGQPRTMQQTYQYSDVVVEVIDFLQQRIDACQAVGIPRAQLLADPGFGFGKGLTHNYQLLAQLADFHRLNVPLLVGMSRKSMLGKLLNREVDDRLAGSITAATIAAMQGAQIIRVHDVRESKDAIAIVNQITTLKCEGE